ncbi:hypothetical protein FB451DRAFT_1252608 [Mycena latifolia]|nr:hypothetical protein FB451DRAFT_1252608 [Mycena latifolia]
MTSSTSTPSKTPRPYSRYHKVAKPQPKPSPVPLPKSRGAYPNPISKELQTEIDVLILAPDADFRLKDFTIKAPAMPNTVWTSIPVDEPKKCEGFLAIGQHIIESSLAYLVYEQRFVAPLSDELVLGCLKSENTLQSVLIQAGVFHEPETVPAHLPAKALKIYLGTLFLSETMTFEAIESWLHHIFRPVVLELRHKPGHVGNYEENRARLAAVHMRKRR